MKKLTPLIKFTIAVSLAILAKLIFLNSFSAYEQLGIMWIVFAFVYICLSLILVFNLSGDSVKNWAAAEDGSRLMVLLLVLAGSLGAIINVLILVTDINVKTVGQPAFVIITLLGAVCSWTLIHLVFTFHYAQHYYRSQKKHEQNQKNQDSQNQTKKNHGLEFPGDEDPDYFDFAYFSFGLGCTFQTSDVSINTKKMRRLVLVHSLLSFFINTFVIALTVNLLAGLR